MIISRKAVVDRIERILNFRESHGECLATGENGESDGQSHISQWQGDTGKGYIVSGGGNRERKLNLFQGSMKRHEASWVSQG